MINILEFLTKAVNFFIVNLSLSTEKCLHSHHSCFVSVSQDYSQLYDLSRSERSKVHELAITMATDGQPLERIGELLHVAVGPLDLSVKSVLRDAVERVVAALRYYVSVCSVSLL